MKLPENLKSKFPAEDIRQMEEVADIVKLEKYIWNNDTQTEHKKRKISVKTAIKLLGEETFWDGIHRAAFHWTAGRQTNDGWSIYFDASEYHAYQLGHPKYAGKTL